MESFGGVCREIKYNFQEHRTPQLDSPKGTSNGAGRRQKKIKNKI